MASRGLPFLKASVDVHNAICAIVLYIGFVRSLGLGGGRQGHINQALSTDKVYFNLPDYNHVALNLVRDSQIFEIFRIRTAQIIFSAQHCYCLA